MNKKCIFCKVIQNKIPSKKYYEDDDIVAIKDINPMAPVHVLILPKKHIRNLNKVTKKDIALLGKIQLVASKLAKKLKIDDGFKVSIANEKKGGQEIFHMHYHLIGGWKEKVSFMNSEKKK